ncbi:MAG: efflux RND transporter periplasmic adaptor subunit [Xanthomonadaceae bacterium]|nr:efflux RND transporter periplasmic adaptor subunit [Xanthomonadaceae bacterium]MDP2184264.1 efflux RND transporter periplasmic adaptor subunit [Xanthomonadales bacterium]MDZ4114810.1 efflux RND transporter periplasmic adaptor subunit [Xanthomonadaceae bacterium]MDZ4377403.1 efflux RND transporter periplasmic adaptor subunit [Xanthomonadaceae bacterium]
MKTLRRATGLALLWALAGCGSTAPEIPVATASPALAELTVQPETAPRERIWDGVVEAVNQATLSAQTGGRVLELPYDVNDYVPAGAVVVRFTAVEQQSGQRRAQAGLAAAQAAATEAEANYQRIAEVFAKKLVARAQLDQATAQRDAARAALESARAAVREAGEQVDYTVIRAPYSGILTQRHVELGETVRPGQPLVSGLSLNQLRVNVEIPQSDMLAVREHDKASVLLADGKRLAAERMVVFPFADPASHSFKVRLELPDAETGLQPGMTVKAAFVIGAAERLLLPLSALVRRSEISGVYVLGEHGPQLRQLRLGHRYGERVEVLAGLDAGERIALDPNAARLALVALREPLHE